MSFDLTPLYHWAPADRHPTILREGLRPGMPPTVSGGRQDVVCFSPDPQQAWAISGAMEWCNEIAVWDLWLAHLVRGDEVWVRPEYAPRITEVRVRGVIPPDRIWWVGRRGDPDSPAGEVGP